jgi:hypothetical protein
MFADDDVIVMMRIKLFFEFNKGICYKASEILNDVLIWALDQEKPVKKLSIKNLINEELKYWRFRPCKGDKHT